MRDDSHIVLAGDNSSAFSKLDESYWQPLVCRHVSKDKRECTIKTSSDTKYEKNGIECKREELAGCYAVVSADIRKYSFWSQQTSKKVAGWQIIAKSIKQKSPVRN
jgi:hypothetical protein